MCIILRQGNWASWTAKGPTRSHLHEKKKKKEKHKYTLTTDKMSKYNECMHDSKFIVYSTVPVPLHSHFMNGVHMSLQHSGLYWRTSSGSLPLSILLRCDNYFAKYIFQYIYRIHSFSYEARPLYGSTTANQNRWLGLAAFSQTPQLLLGSGTRHFCPEQISSVQCCHILSFSQVKWVVWKMLKNWYINKVDELCTVYDGDIEDKYDIDHEELVQPLPNFYCHFAIPVGTSSASQEKEWTTVPSIYLHF